MFFNFVIPFLIICAPTNAETYKWKIEKQISEAFYNPYLDLTGLISPKMDATWKKNIEKSDEIMMQAYYLYNKEYKFVNYSLCGKYAEKSQEKLFQNLTYHLFTGKQTCPIKKGTVSSPEKLNLTTSVKGLPKCGKTTVKINGYRNNLSKQYFGHFLYVLIVVTIAGGKCK